MQLVYIGQAKAWPIFFVPNVLPHAVNYAPSSGIL